MRSALTRLTLLVGASLLLCVWSGAGLALAGQPTNPAQGQYFEQYPTVHHKKHTSTTPKRHKATGTVKPRTSTTETPSTPTYVSPPVTGETTAQHTGTARHHKTARRRARKRHKSTVKLKPAASRRSHVLASKRLPVAAATGSGGGLSVWLLVILALVLVTGSTAGVLRYRRNHH